MPKMEGESMIVQNNRMQLPCALGLVFLLLAGCNAVVVYKASLRAEMLYRRYVL
jgi:hypothetical protein